MNIQNYIHDKQPLKVCFDPRNGNKLIGSEEDGFVMVIPPEYNDKDELYSAFIESLQLFHNHNQTGIFEKLSKHLDKEKLSEIVLGYLLEDDTLKSNWRISKFYLIIDSFLLLVEKKRLLESLCQRLGITSFREELQLLGSDQSLLYSCHEKGTCMLINYQIACSFENDVKQLTNLQELIDFSMDFKDIPYLEEFDFEFSDYRLDCESGEATSYQKALFNGEKVIYLAQTNILPFITKDLFKYLRVEAPKQKIIFFFLCWQIPNVMKHVREGQVESILHILSQMRVQVIPEACCCKHDPNVFPLSHIFVSSLRSVLKKEKIHECLDFDLVVQIIHTFVSKLKQQIKGIERIKRKRDNDESEIDRENDSELN